MTTNRADTCKHAIRRQVWTLLDQRGVLAGDDSTHGRIPHFVGAARRCCRPACRAVGVAERGGD
jgi:hypothetical protein